MHRAIVLANERRHEYATLEHLLLALIDDDEAAAVMRACNVDLEELRRTVSAYVDDGLSSIIVDTTDDAKPTAGFQRVVQRAVIHIQSSNREEVTGANVLVALFSERESHAASFLQEQDFTRYDAINYISHGIAKKSGMTGSRSGRWSFPETPEAAALLPPPTHMVDHVVRDALAEDLGEAGDITSALAVPADAAIRARFCARAPGRIAGTVVLAATFRALDPAIRGRVLLPDGADVAQGQAIATVQGSARAVLAGERTALNLLSHLSGVATLTRAYVQAVEGTKARIAHTRKTTPGLRALESYAVRCGGGVAHRQGLYDAVLIKDNHIAAAGGVAAALSAVRARAGHMVRVSVEVDSLAQLEEALAHKPDVVLLDNFSLADLAEAVRLVDGRAVLEASGGVSLAAVRAIAETGVDVISVGALTHSAPALDIGLDVEADR
jgi:nicotinate-nucleotide pyrophosphorylase (carboxylating)